jgi:PAS domain S-box-containing protein
MQDLPLQFIFTFFDSNPDPVIGFDDQQHVIYSNPCAESLFGGPKSSLLGRHIDDLLPNNQRVAHSPNGDQPIAQISAGNHGKTWARKVNGELIATGITYNPVSFEGHHYLFALLRDLSANPFRSERNQRDSDLYRELVESQSNLIVRTDANGKFIYANRAYCEKFGYRLDELIGNTVTTEVHPDDLAYTLTSRKKLESPPNRVVIEHRLRTAAGWRWFSWESSVIFDDQGQLLEVQAVGRDITESVENKILLVAQRDLANSLAGISSINNALALCVSKALEVSGADCGGIYLVDRQTLDLDLAYCTGFSERIVALVSHYSNGSSQWKMVMGGKPIFFHYQELGKGQASIPREEGLCGFGIIPILHQERVIACFNLASHTMEELTPTGQLAAIEVAIQVGNAIARIQAEEQTHETQQELDQLFDIIHDFIVVFDIDGRIVKVNQQVVDRLGYAQDELIGQPVALMHPPEMRERAKVYIQDMLEGKRESCALDLLAKNGERLPVETIVNAGKWGDRPVWIGVSRDITERLQAEKLLQFRTEFENLLTEISTRFINVGAFEIDKEINLALAEIGRIQNMDRTSVFLTDNEQMTMTNTHEWCQVGIEPQMDLLKDIPWDLFPWWMDRISRGETIMIDAVAELPLEAAAEKEILEAQGIQSIAVVPLTVNKTLHGFARFDVTRRYHHWSPDNIALLLQFSNILSNALEFKRVQAELEVSLERNRAIVDALPDNLFRITKDGTIVDYVAADASTLILPLGEIKGIRLDDILGADQALQAREKIRTAIATNQKQTMEYQIKMEDRINYFEARFVSTGAKEVIGIVRDVSERARLEQMKSDFINRATHELRTPLTTILLMIRLLEGECTEEEYTEYWKVMKEELQREHQLIEDLLVAGRLESDRWAVKLQPMNPATALRASLLSLMPIADRKGIHIQIGDLPDDLCILGDLNSLQEVYTNLISNAVKFTATGGWVKLSLLKQDEKVCFQIRDTGMGIPADDLPNLFSRFFRGQNATENEVPGSGIGLYIVKSIIEHFGGSIRVESQLNKGSLFEFWLPLTNLMGNCADPAQPISYPQ